MKNIEFLDSGGDDGALSELASRIERGLLADLSGKLPSSGQDSPEPAAHETIFLSFDQINAWLAVRLPQWAAHKNIPIPRALSHFMVAADNGSLVVAFQYDTPGVRQIFSILVDLHVLPNGRAKVVQRGVRAGKLPIPFRLIRKYLAPYTGARRFKELEAVLGGRPFDAVFNHPGDSSQTLRLVDLTVRDDGVAVTLRREPR